MEVADTAAGMLQEMVRSDPASRLMVPPMAVPISSVIWMSVMGWEPLLVRVMRNRVPSAVAGYYSTSILRSTATRSTVTDSRAEVLDSTPRTVY